MDILDVPRLGLMNRCSLFDCGDGMRRARKQTTVENLSTCPDE
jgi:hypothetical protein